MQIQIEKEPSPLRQGTLAGPESKLRSIRPIWECYEITSPCARCTVSPINTKTLVFWTEKGLLQVHTGDRRLMPSHLKVTESFQQAPLKAEAKRCVVSCCNLLGVRSFALEVGSWSGNDVPQISACYSVLKRKGKGPRPNLPPPRSQSWLRGGSSFRGRFPHPAQLLSLREPGIQPNCPSASPGHPNGRDQLSQTAAQAVGHCY